MGSVSDEKLTLTCPDCGADLTVDRRTGTVLHHRPAAKERPPEKDFDQLLAGIDESKARSEDIFRREVSAFKDRNRLMEEKFREAMRRAEEEPDDEPPVRPWDLD